jgi:hypothetical protein
LGEQHRQGTERKPALLALGIDRGQSIEYAARSKRASELG